MKIYSYQSDFLYFVEKFGTYELSSIIGLLVGGGLVILALGFILGSITVAVISLFCRLRGVCYEAPFDKETILRMLKPLNMEGDFFEDVENIKDYTLYVAATYSYELYDESVLAWITRRWNAFNVSAFSFFGIFLSLVTGIFIFQFGHVWIWLLICLLLLLCFGYNAWRNFTDMKRMNVFQSYRWEELLGKSELKKSQTENGNGE